MKKLLYLLPMLLLLTACGAEEGRAAALQATYAALSGYEAEVKLEIPREAETLRYTLAVASEGEETSVEVLSPELLAGVTAKLRGEELSLSYDGLLLDAGTVSERVSALSCVPLVLRAVGEGYVTQESEERFADADALRLCFGFTYGGDTLTSTVYFLAEDAPLYAELCENEKIIAFIEFTNFTFGDILLSDAQEETE